MNPESLLDVLLDVYNGRESVGSNASAAETRGYLHKIKSRYSLTPRGLALLRAAKGERLLDALQPTSSAENE